MNKLDGSVLHHDHFDARAWHGATQDYSALPRAAEGLTETLATAAALLGDAFLSFYKAAPALCDQRETPAPYRLHRELMEQLMQTDEWHELRAAGTVADPTGAAIATLGLVDALAQAIPPDATQRQNELAARHDDLLRLQRLLEGLNDLTEQADEEVTQRLVAQAQALQDELGEAEEALLDAEAAATDQAGDLLDSMRQAARAAMSETADELNSLTSLSSALGAGIGAGLGGSSDMTVQEKMSLAERVRELPKLREIAELCGRLRRLARQVQREKLDTVAEEVIGVTAGNDLRHVLPSELLLLTDPTLELLFFKRYQDRSLLQYETQREEDKGKGPIVVALDSSGSMTNQIAGTTKEAWSKAVALALLMIARQQKRNIALMHFSGGQTVKSFHFLAHEPDDPEAVIEAISYFENGGTVFEPWLKAALQLVEDSAFDGADVICLSDGATTVGQEMIDEWGRVRADRNMNVYSVLIGTQTGLRVLDQISDEVVTMWELTSEAEEEGLARVFAI